MYSGVIGMEQTRTQNGIRTITSDGAVVSQRFSVGLLDDFDVRIAR